MSEVEGLSGGAQRRSRRTNDGQRRTTRASLDFDDLIYGIHSVAEALGAGDELRLIHVAANRAKDAVLRELLAKAKERDVPVRFERRAFFDRVPFKAHQGIVALARPFPYASLNEILARTSENGLRRLIVVLDHLTDPHNVGAIVRTAEAAGAQGVVLPVRRSAGVNATVRKAAAGAADHIPIARANIAEAIRALKKAGFWVVGADVSRESIELGVADLARDLALVVGAEGLGLSQLVKRECDYLVRLPMRGKVASLNVSVAAGILMYEARRQQGALASSLTREGDPPIY
ncbi:MAG TPA: 23S rRNA (guanosine(2251)-2'-O)-methyltransferase RlmB [Candidatus Babeliales bacterium]|nr:23S rRNA (guanosine(2251)-2'-O)-methyltransferase RlmB [Candidatus Babeliales bacterium]